MPRHYDYINRPPGRKPTHGGWGTGAYQTWRVMHQRCRDPKHPAFKYYGGRGIGIDDPRWHEFVPFREDMGERPPGCDLHRKDNDKGYSKENCVWLPGSEHKRLHAKAQWTASPRSAAAG
jgi:hypothetical protein